MGALVESSTDLKSSHLPMERPQALPISPQNVILFCPHYENENKGDKLVNTFLMNLILGMKI